MRLVPALFVPFALVASAVAQITFQHERGKALVAADAKVERLATDHEFTEGPVWDVAKQRLVYSDIPVQRWFTWTRRFGSKELGASAGANGNTLDAERRLLSCRHDARDVVRHEADGTLTVLVDAHDGKKLNSPNDVAVHQDGSVWFTDPTYGLGKRTKEQAGNFVYRFDPKSKDVRVVQRDFDMPNGLCFAPDGKTLWIADSGRKQRIGAFPVRDDGTLGEPIRWLDGGADGVRCDTAGNLWAAAGDGVRVFGADGQRLLTIALPEMPANLAFGGDDFRTLFVTARTSLYALPVLATGAQLMAPAANGEAGHETGGASAKPAAGATTPPSGQR